MLWPELVSGIMSRCFSEDLWAFINLVVTRLNQGWYEMQSHSPESALGTLLSSQLVTLLDHLGDIAASIFGTQPWWMFCKWQMDVWQMGKWLAQGLKPFILTCFIPINGSNREPSKQWWGIFSRCGGWWRDFCSSRFTRHRVWMKFCYLLQCFTCLCRC